MFKVDCVENCVDQKLGDFIKMNLPKDWDYPVFIQVYILNETDLNYRK